MGTQKDFDKHYFIAGTQEYSLLILWNYNDKLYVFNC